MLSWYNLGQISESVMTNETQNTQRCTHCTVELLFFVYVRLTEANLDKLSNEKINQMR